MIEERLAEDMKAAMRGKEARRLGVIRMLRAKLMERHVQLRAKHGRDHVLTDEEAVEVIAAYAKQRRDSIEAYESAARPDLAAIEAEELAIVGNYLPAQLDEPALRALIAAAIAESGAGSPADMGAVMRLVMPRVKGRADGNAVNRIARELLTG